MEHAIRAQIHERLEQNPVFYERLSQRLARIIEQMRAQLIDAAEAYQQMAVLQKEVHGEATVAARHGSIASVSGYLRDPAGTVLLLTTKKGQVRQDACSYIIDMDDSACAMSRLQGRRSAVLNGHAVIEWQTNDDVQRQMRRDVKGRLRTTGLYDAKLRMDELANLIVQVAKSRV